MINNDNICVYEMKYKHDMDLTNTNENNVALFIRSNGGTIKNYETKLQLLKDYCSEKGYHLEKILKFNCDYIDSGYYSVTTQLELIIKNLGKFNKILMFDLAEITDYVYPLYTLLDIISDYNISIETICDGEYLYNFHIEDDKIIINNALTNNKLEE